MKKKDRYKILNYAKQQYSESFLHDYQFKHLSKKALLKLLQEHDYSSMCEWSYCCYGSYQNCWQELYSEGTWGMTQEAVDKIIAYTIKETAKICRKDNRILYYKTEVATHIVIVARDIMSKDCLITFQNKKDYKFSLVVANNIRRYMGENNVSVEDVVERTSLSQVDFGRVLSGNMIAPSWMLKEIANAIGCDKGDLIKDKWW